MTQPLGTDEFARSMAALGPFECSPHVAVACSGGPDSMALAFLAADWARGRGGQVTALVVDHAMRAESADEAALVCERLARAGIEAVLLTRQGTAPRADRQAVARAARYALMTDWCRSAGVLHLLLGHHRADQAETLVLRLGRGSGVDGLAAMAPVVETPYLRLLRPLLGVTRERLSAILECRGMDYVRDPSNEDASFARVRVRRLLPDLHADGLTESRLAATARRMGRARAALERAATAFLAQAASIYPEGYATLDDAKLMRADEEIALRALSRLLTCVGGGRHAPRLEGLERLYDWLTDGAAGGKTLAGCRIVRQNGGKLLISREAVASGRAVPAAAGACWDGRFRLLAAGPRDSRVRRLGPDGWRQIRTDCESDCAKSLPADVRDAIPAIWSLEQVVAVPHLNYQAEFLDGKGFERAEIAFLPARPLGGASFSLPEG